MSAMARQVSLKWLAGMAPLWLIAEIEHCCCADVEPGEQCEHKSQCSQRAHCRAIEAERVTHYAAMHCGKRVPSEAMQHVIDGRVAVIRTDSVTWESRQ